MTDIFANYDPNRLSKRINKIRKNRSEQYKMAKKYFDDASELFDKKSEEYKKAESYFKNCEKYKSCTSQESLAEAINVKRQTIIDWEKGKTYPSVDKLILLCSTFNCNMDYLFGLVETPLTEPVSIAHFFSKIDSPIIEYGLANEDYRDCLNFFYAPRQLFLSF